MNSTDVQKRLAQIVEMNMLERDPAIEKLNLDCLSSISISPIFVRVIEPILLNFYRAVLPIRRSDDVKLVMCPRQTTLGNHFTPPPLCAAQ